MSTRRDFLKQTAASGVVAAASMQVARAVEDAGSGGMEQPNVDKTNLSWRSRIKSVIRRDETVLRYGVHGDNWHMSWASDDRQYVSACDGVWFTDHSIEDYNSRIFAINGGPRDAKFHDIPGYPILGSRTQKPGDTRYYNFGTLALDRQIYQFMSTYNRSRGADDQQNSDVNNLRFNGAKLIYSPDNGRTWHNQDGSTPVTWEPWGMRSRNTMVFFEEDQEAFSLLTVLQMGKNYEHNRDGYIYVYAPNGNTEGTMNELVMFRVPKGKLLDREHYEYFAGWSADRRPRWSRDIKARAVVHTFPRGWVNSLIHPFAWQPSVVYNAPLGLYMMANWGMGTAPDGLWFGKPSYLGFWISHNPWGPWTQIHEETAWLPAGDERARAYQPQIAPKWIAADGKSFWLVWTDYQEKDKGALERFNERMQEKLQQNNPDNDLAKLSVILREYQPFYAFNVQRYDLVVA
ncbi:twin-arginine translocation signal domain-containing protein [Peristeroidobacter agariperforans]|uniref:twin-arginine translocation signal domain-containing protein n=1 Tax=Peristeroidobacter agariperforans TaxID=268404 RepID=UPI0018E56508|nr:twin-arginine translocation signal domain-containing protein [Peristeroidobacter agariperforans]